MNKKALVFLTIVTIAFLTALPSYAAFWDVEQVYSGGFANGDCSIAIGPENIPSISYTAAGDLYLASKDLGGWSSTRVTAAGFAGGYSSLAFTPDGQPCIAYIECPDYFGILLRFAYKQYGNWNFETVRDIGWLPSNISLGFNSSGKPCIAFCRAVGELFSVSFARRIDSGVWFTEDIAQVGDVTKPAMVINGNDIYIAFVDASSSELKLATSKGDGQWNVKTLDGSSSSPVFGQSAIALGPDGIPCVAYFQLSLDRAELKFLRIAASFAPETVATLSMGFFYNCALSITQGGIPMIGYFDPSTGRLMNAWKFGGRWFTEEIDPLPPPGGHLSYALDSLGNVNAAYFDCQDYNVKFASALAPVTIAEAKCLPDNSLVQISGAVASTAKDEIGNCIYVQNADRGCGIQLYFSDVPPVVRGMVLDIQGMMATVNGERAILDPDLVEISSPISLRPVGLKNSDIGGSDFHYSEGPPVVGQKGVLGGTGLNNIGLLVRTWGHVESVGTDWFVINDGSNAHLKCYAPNLTLPGLNSLVMVTGISSCEESGSNLLRLLKVRSQNDIAILFQP
ncbi:MAG: hypothetical protein K6T99_01645 [Armatimonadetes bacterium]|nr:hypothetical protein [Armatimonadota bacterium]